MRSFALTVVMVAAMPLAAAAQDVGPARGALVIAGGGVRDLGIIQRFLELAGGKDAPIVVVPTAEGADAYSQYWSGLRQFKEAGATRLTVLHTGDRTVADSEEFVKPIREAQGVWFGGGRHWRIADSYLNTRTQKELFALLGRGGVIGGSSAGATIQGSYMVRGDTKGNTIMMGDHEIGFGFLKNVTIDQHVLRRNRQFDMIEVIEKHSELLGLGIDENTAIVVRGDQFEVIGSSYVLVYDNQRMLDSGGRFYFLAPGDRYDLKTREATRPSTSQQPIDRVIRKSWRQ